MSLLADRIEELILQRLLEAAEDMAILQRNELADELECAPSQISYVLNTRFNPDRGFIVESRRGLGGFIRIQRVQAPGILQVRVRQHGEEDIDERTDGGKKQQEKADSVESLPERLCRFRPENLAEADKCLHFLLTNNCITKREAQLLHDTYRIVFIHVNMEKREKALGALGKALADIVGEE